MRNNPVNFNDPSGHCTGDSEDAQNPDIACWQKLNDLSQKFSNIKFDPAFNLWQLELIGISLDLVLHAFGDVMGAFQKALGNFSILYAGPWVDRSVTPPGLNRIYLGDSTFIQNGNLAGDAIQVIIHEIGHIFDFNGSGGFTNSYKSSVFVRVFNTGSCFLGLVGCIGNQASNLYKWLDYSLIAGTNYSPTGSTSLYGSTSSIDDFAESFAGYVLRFNGLNTTIPYDRDRENIIAIWINLAVR